MTPRAVVRGMLAAVTLVVAACSGSAAPVAPYGAQAARVGESLSVLGWNIAVSDLRWAADHVLVDVSASVADPDADHAAPEDLRFGLYGAVAQPLEATGIGSCGSAVGATSRPLTAIEPEKLTGTVCLGPTKDRSTVRGVYVYSPQDRIAGTTVAYPAAFPLGVLATGEEDTGLAVTTTSVEAWRADGRPVTQAALGDAAAFTGDGVMLLGLAADAPAARYREQSQARGGPMMLVAGPSTPGPGPLAACAGIGSSVLILPDASLGAVHVGTTLCTQGEINAAVLYPTVSVIGTHAAVWVDRE